MFLLGLVACVAGNAVIGCGQTLQKLGLVSEPQQKDIQKDSAEMIAKRRAQGTWLAGLLLAYAGELGGNWVALSYVSAAVVAPLGFIAVLVNAWLADRWLQERIGRRQWRGLLWSLAGVLLTVVCAPKHQSSVERVIFDHQDSMAELPPVNRWLVAMQNESAYLKVVMVLCLVALMTLYTILVRRREDLPRYVLVCACFGAVSVLSSKALSLLLRAASYSDTERKSTSPHVHSNDGGRHVHHDEVGAPTGEGALSVGPPAFTLILTLIIAIVALETCRQHALRRFPVTQFQPMLYAAFNCLVAVSSVVVFRELDEEGWWGRLSFYAGFTLGMGLVVRGSLLMMGSPESRGQWSAASNATAGLETTISMTNTTSAGTKIKQ